jgi:hypothetical protein
VHISITGDGVGECSLLQAEAQGVSGQCAEGPRRAHAHRGLTIPSHWRLHPAPIPHPKLHTMQAHSNSFSCQQAHLTHASSPS